jgi:glucose-6-phosphate 1-epimerase
VLNKLFTRRKQLVLFCNNAYKDEKNMNTITALNQQFAENSIQFVQSPEGLPLVVMQHTEGTATVSLYAGQVLSYCPADQATMTMQPVFWMSSAAQFALGHAIRGGIPLCWPWFGPHSDEEKPKHGFARTEMWQVVSTSTQAEALELVLTLPCTPDLAALWGEFSVFLTIRVGATLSVSLKTTNLSTQTLLFLCGRCRTSLGQWFRKYGLLE